MLSSEYPPPLFCMSSFALLQLTTKLHRLDLCGALDANHSQLQAAQASHLARQSLAIATQAEQQRQLHARMEKQQKRMEEEAKELAVAVDAARVSGGAAVIAADVSLQQQMQDIVTVVAEAAGMCARACGGEGGVVGVWVFNCTCRESRP